VAELAKAFGMSILASTLGEDAGRSAAAGARHVPIETLLGGRLLVIAETHKGRSVDWLYRPAMTLLRATYLTAAEHEDLLTTAGYAAVEIVEDRKRGWICCLGTRPAERGAPVRGHIQGSSADGP
jgi:hypothetical protein